MQQSISALLDSLVTRSYVAGPKGGGAQAAFLEQIDMRITLAESTSVADLANLRLVDKEITGAQLTQLCTSFSRATSLDLSGSTQLSHDSLSILIPLAPSLQCLDLSRCGWLGAYALHQIAVLSHLENLSLASVPATARSVFAEGLGQLTQLRTLDLSENRLLTADSVMAIAGLKNLTSLNLSLQGGGVPRYARNYCFGESLHQLVCGLFLCLLVPIYSVGEFPGHQYAKCHAKLHYSNGGSRQSRPRVCVGSVQGFIPLDGKGSGGLRNALSALLKVLH